ncbi:MAG: stage III sporulation protein AC [Christensenellales bacterium]
MGVDILFKIAGVGLLTAVINQILTQAGKNEIATLSTLAGVVIVLVMIVDMVASLFGTIRNLFGL